MTLFDLLAHRSLDNNRLTVRRYPRALTCSAGCSIEHQVRLNRVRSDAILSADVAHVANRPQTPAGESGERLAPLTGARTGWGARSPSIPAVGVVRHRPAEKTPLRAAQRVGVFAVDRENGAFGPIRSDPVRKGRAPCRRGSRDAFACSV